MLDDKLHHLPERKRLELERVVRFVFQEFENAQSGKPSSSRRGEILKLVLFGSYARGDWVEDAESGYRSDYDILVIVNIHSFAEQNDVWRQIDDKLANEFTIRGMVTTPVTLIVHSIEDVNDKLARGNPLFADIARDGIFLHDTPDHKLVVPRDPSPDVKLTEAKGHFRKWFTQASKFMVVANEQAARGWTELEAFNMHQATESLYHCVLLVLTLYSPKSHRLKMLRAAAESIEPRLISAWPRDTRFTRRCFERLDRAYVDARYSPNFEISNDELRWLSDRLAVLRDIVEVVCKEKLDD